MFLKWQQMTPQTQEVKIQKQSLLIQHKNTSLTDGSVECGQMAEVP